MLLVNFSNIEALTQFRYLGNGYESEVHGHVKLFQDKEIRIGHNYDLNIESSLYGGNASIYSTYLKQLSVNRFDKVVQQHILKVFSSKFDNYYHHLNTSYFGDLSLLIRTTEAILKPRAGARSLCTLRYNNLKYSQLNIQELITTELKPLLTDVSEIKSVEDFRNSPIQKFFDKYEMVFNIGQIREISETLGHLKDLVNKPNTYAIQECIGLKNITELRVIRGVDGKVKLVAERPDLDDGYQGFSPEHQWEPEHGYNMRDEIMTFIEDADFPLLLGSIDVWYDRTTSRWGIFEFQPQFSPKHHPTKDMWEILKEMVDQLISLQIREEAKKPFGIRNA